MLTALENWVENDTAPEGICRDQIHEHTPAQGIVRTMPFCKFPEMANYNGVGQREQRRELELPSRRPVTTQDRPERSQAGEAAALSYRHKPDQQR
jgi:hypothetical protein